MATKKQDEWFQDAAFWDRFAPIMFDEQRWAEVPGVADGIEALCGTGRSLAILDQCCGLGRLSVELGLRGHRLTGVDITQSYLDAARESAQDEGLSIEFIQDDVRRFVRSQSYDLVLNLYTSFGYFADPEDDRQVVENAYESLVPGGLYIIETLGKELAVRDYTEGEWFERSGAVVLTEFEPIQDWEYLKNRWILLQGTERFERTFLQRLYSATELKRLMVERGFTSVALYGDWDRRPYDYRAQKMIVLGRK